MNDLPQIPRVETLIDEALDRLSTGGADYLPAITSAFEQAIHSLRVEAADRRNYPILLSAARRRVATAEELVIARLTGDEYYSGEEASILVRVRLICREVLHLLQHALAEVRPA